MSHFGINFSFEVFFFLSLSSFAVKKSVSIKRLKYSRNVFLTQISKILFVVELFAQAVKKVKMCDNKKIGHFFSCMPFNEHFNSSLLFCLFYLSPDFQFVLNAKGIFFFSQESSTIRKPFSLMP